MNDALWAPVTIYLENYSRTLLLDLGFTGFLSIFKYTRPSDALRAPPRLSPETVNLDGQAIFELVWTSAHRCTHIVGCLLSMGRFVSACFLLRRGRPIANSITPKQGGF